MHFLELPLVFFTVLAQCAVGGYLVITARLACTKGHNQQRLLASKTIFFVLVFMAIGFASSTMHLGSPFRAFNSLNRVGDSGLSNEIITGSIFFALAGIYWLAEVLCISKPNIRSLLRYLAAIAGIIFMVAMIKVYLIETVPLWNNIFTPIDFIFTVITAGMLFGFLLLNAFNGSSVKANKVVTAVGLLLIATHLVLMIARILSFATVNTSIHHATANLHQYTPMIMTQCILMIIAAILWVRAAHRPITHNTSVALIAFIALFVAEIFGRGVFYGMHFTVGLV